MSLYVVLFPQLVAGPIVRYKTIEEELTTRTIDFELFSQGVRRFIYGLAKKILLANFMAQIADNIFDYTIGRSMGLAWIGAIAYTLQIYYDFSGYSDMAIGLGAMFGFHFPENFNYPYISKNVTEFWRRWHITLSTWFRDYVYIPMGGNRCVKVKAFRNLFLVWLLTGIWHGANWTFIVWGLFYFVVLTVEKLTGLNDKKSFITRIYTLIIIIIAWVIFRANSIGEAAHYIGQLVGIGANGVTFGCYVTIKRTYLIFILSLTGVTPLFKRITEHKINKNGVMENIWLMIVFIFSLLVTIKGSYNPFIYFNF